MEYAECQHRMREKKQQKMEEIAEFIDTMQIKKASFGGFDKTDVYNKMLDLNDMYEEYMDDQLDMVAEMEKQIKQLSQEIEQERLKSQNYKENLQEAQIKNNSISYERPLFSDSSNAMSNDLSKLSDENYNLKQEIRMLQDRLRMSEDRLRDHEQMERRDADQYVSAVLHEAELEGQRLIESAKSKAREESIRMRAQYKIELEQIQIEKQSIADLLRMVERELANAGQTVSNLNNRLATASNNYHGKESVNNYGYYTANDTKTSR